MQLYTERLIEAVVTVHTTSTPLGHGRSSLTKRCNEVALVFMGSTSEEAGLHVNLAIVEAWLPRDFCVKIEHLVRATLLAQGGRWSNSNRRLPCDVLDLPVWAQESIMSVDATHLREYLCSHENADGLFDESARPVRASTRVSQQTAGRQLEQRLIEHFASSAGAADDAVATLATKCAVFSYIDLAVSPVTPPTQYPLSSSTAPLIGVNCMHLPILCHSGQRSLEQTSSPRDDNNAVRAHLRWARGHQCHRGASLLVHA